jgi:hypothetical protein
MSATPAPAGPPAESTEEKVSLDVKSQIRRVVQGDLASVRVVFGLALIAPLTLCPRAVLCNRMKLTRPYCYPERKLRG